MMTDWETLSEVKHIPPEQWESLGITGEPPEEGVQWADEAIPVMSLFLEDRPRKCKLCGKSYTGTRSSRYCSPGCQVQAIARRVAETATAYICLHCGKAFLPTQRKRTGFCSRPCYVGYRNNGDAAWNTPVKASVKE